MDAIGPWSNEANGFQDTGGSEQNADLFGMVSLVLDIILDKISHGLMLIIHD